jgi:hypothetical protein
VPVREASAEAGQDAARPVEEPDPAALVEDHREGKEHRELEEAYAVYSILLLAPDVFSKDALRFIAEAREAVSW